MLDARVQDNHPRSVPESGGEVQCELLIGSRVSYFLITVATLSEAGPGAGTIAIIYQNLTYFIRTIFFLYKNY